MARLILRCIAVLVYALAVARGQKKRARCVFVHGSGSTVTAPTDGNDTTGYWGGTKYVKSLLGDYCDSLIFTHQDTETRGWDNPTLQGAVCKAIVGASVREESDPSVAEDVFVFTHSMGNNVMAGALADGRCSLGDNSDWFALSAPWDGSKAADWVAYLCSDPGGFDVILSKLADELGYCNGTKVSRAYLSMQTSYPGLLDGTLRRIASSHVSGGICGTSDFGLTSAYSIAFEALSHEVKYGEDNDGMVGISSCLLGGKTYAGDWHTSSWYKAEINHVDATLRNGGGSFGSVHRQPALWLAKQCALKTGIDFVLPHLAPLPMTRFAAAVQGNRSFAYPVGSANKSVTIKQYV